MENTDVQSQVQLKPQSAEKAIEFDFLQLVGELWRRAWIIVLTAIIFAAGSLGYTYYFIAPSYQTNVAFYVNNTSISVGSVGVSISNSDISAAQKLVDTYVVILKSRITLNEIIEEAGLQMNYKQLSSKISAKAENDTEIFRVYVTDTDPNRAEKIATTILKVLPDKISSVVDGSSVKIVDTAFVPTGRSAPSYSRSALLGFIVGIIFSAALIILKKFFDPYVKSEEYITQTYNLPLLAVIPRVSTHSSGSGYGYYKKGYYKSGYYRNNYYKNGYYRNNYYRNGYYRNNYYDGYRRSQESAKKENEKKD